jgi:hypothetical protein
MWLLDITNMHFSLFLCKHLQPPNKSTARWIWLQRDGGSWVGKAQTAINRWPLSFAFLIGLCCSCSFVCLPARISHFLPSLLIYRGAMAWFGGSWSAFNFSSCLLLAESTCQIFWRWHGNKQYDLWYPKFLGIISWNLVSFILVFVLFCNN